MIDLHFQLLRDFVTHDCFVHNNMAVEFHFSGHSNVKINELFKRIFSDSEIAVYFSMSSPSHNSDISHLLDLYYLQQSLAQCYLTRLLMTSC